MGAIVAGGLTGLLNQSSAQVIDGSLKFNSASSNVLKRTPGVAGNRKTWTWSSWVVRTTFGTEGGIFSTYAGAHPNTSLFWESESLKFHDYTSSYQIRLGVYPTTFLDTGWYHIVLAYDSTESTVSDRAKLYVNGTLLTLSGTTVPANHETDWNSTTEHNIGRFAAYYDGSMSQCYHIDGQALGPENFGYTDGLTNTWRPKKFSGSFTTTSVFDGTIWTNKHSGTVYGGSVANVFDSNLTNRAEINNSDSNDNHFTISSISVKASKIGVYVSHSGSDVEVSINGSVVGTIASGSITTSSQLFSFTFTETTITSIKVRRVGSTSGWYLYGINVDDVRLLDGANFTGVNSFYLPMDGNSPIGEDKTGNGNDWTPANFGGSVALDNPIVSGALPILNTDGGGNVARVGVRTDANAANLVLALPLVGSANDVSNSVNSGSTTKTITSTNAVANYAFSNFYGGSWYFDGSGDYINASSNSDFTFGTGDFTIEGWVYPVTNNANKTVFSTNWGANGSILITFSHPSAGGAGKFGFFDHTSSSGSPKVTTSNAYPINKWHHVAFVRNGTSHKFYINGIEDGSATYSASDLTRDVFIFGAVYTNGTETFDGYIQDSRIYKGVAKYTGNFVVPATSPDILPDTPSGVSGSSKLAKITDGAVAFDGTGDYLSTPQVASTYDWFNDAFTLEYYVYPNAFGVGANSNTNMVGKSDPNSNPESWSFGAKADGTVEWYYWVGSQKRLTTTDTIALKKWTHLAFTHDGSDGMKIFIDGKVAASGNIDGTPAALSEIPFNIGKNANAAFNGMISNLRMVRGNALYTANFTPPSAPLTNVTNTKLLCCQSNTSANLTGVSPATFSNSGTVYSSNYAASDSFQATAPATNGFDGNITTRSACSSSGCTVTMTFSPALTVGTSLKIWSGYGVASVNGGTAVNFRQTSPRRQWQDLSFTGTLNTIVITGNDSGYGGDASAGECYAVEVDGCILVDGLAGEAIASAGDVAATNFNPFNTDINTVRGQETGYPTFNPLIVPGGGDSQGSGGSLSDGNLTIKSGGSTGNYLLASCSPAIPLTGKYYFEFTTISAINTDNNTIGIFNPTSPVYSSGDYARINPSFSGSFTTTKKRSGTATNLAGSAGDFSGGDVVNIAIDSDNRSIWFGKNGVYYEGNPSLGTGASYTNLTAGVEYVVRSFVYTSGGTEAEGRINFGQKPFKFPPPAGFQPLNAANVRPETVITRPDHYVAATLWTGNGGTQSVNVGLKPDFVWIKRRDDSAKDHNVYDSVRGSSGGYFNQLVPNVASKENNNSSDYGRLTSLNSNGFTLDSATSDHSLVNDSGDSYVAWSWKAGGNKGTFNIDDVGYANASDVGMNVGALNSSTYNQTSTWSSGLTNSGITDPQHIFNGVLGVLGSNWATGTYAYSSSQNNGGTLSGLNLPTGTYRIRAYSNNSGAQIRINGGSYYTAPSGANVNEWWTITETTITSIEWIGGTTVYISGLECNGLLLVDNGISLNVPSIANTGCSVGTRQGFSIVKYQANLIQGATIAHGLTQKPDFAIFKNRDSTLGTNEVDWGVYHSSIGATQRLELNQSIAAAAFPGPFNDTEPTSSIFTFGGGSQGHSYLTNGPSGDDFIGYIWHDVPGLQKFGSFEGNDAANGPFIELGFRPAVILLKNADATQSWVLIDGTRDAFNPSYKWVQPDTSAVENTTTTNNCVDILSNGFKPRGATNTNDATNGPSQTIIYAAWAEAPTFNLYGAQSNAR